MRTFVLIKQNSGLVTSEQLSAGLYEALITSALGIVVAVPAFTFYSYLASFARTLMHDMERAGIEIVNLIHDSRTDRSLIVEFRPEPDQLGGSGPGPQGQSPFKGPKASGAR